MTLKIFEMFAGYGGASFSLKKAEIDFECIGFSEIDKYAIQCFEQNHKGKNYGDCSKIKTNELPDFDLLTGGFPCQDVSIAGKRDLSKGRTNLYHEILRIAKDKKPKFMLLENVKGLLSVNKDRNLRDIIINDLRNIGYDVCFKLLNSKDFGIPQNRERVWFVCKLGKFKFGEFNFQIPKDTNNISLKDILEYKVDEKYYLSNKILDKLNLNHKMNFPCYDRKTGNPIDNICSCIRSGIGSGNQKLIQINNPKHSNDRVYSAEGVSPTLNTMQGGNRQPFITHYLFPRSSKTNKGGTGHLSKTDGLSYCIDTGNTQAIEYEKNFRKLTPKECFRLMGFLNDEINLEGLSDTQKYKLAGNGWDINIVSLIFKEMMKIDRN